jgi:multimeric flavodoxin WrbA
MKVVAIGGSPRKNGNTDILIDEVLKEVSARGIETEKIIISEYKINPCQGHANCGSFSECKQKDDATWILEKFSQAEAVVLASPVYYYSISAQIKAFMDRNYFFYTHDQEIKAKYAVLIAIGGGEGADEAIDDLKNMFKFSDTRIFSIAGYADKPGDVKKQPKLIKQAQDMGRQLAECLTSNGK